MFLNKNNIIYIDKFNQLEIDLNVFSNLIEKYPDINIFIFVIKTENIYSKGGTINNKPLVILSNNYKKRTILHEICHALFNLGDEYSNNIDIKLSEKELSKYKNISKNKNNSEWDEIKKITKDEKINYYEGGLGIKKNIFHSYPDCLMKDLSSDLCPICLYYTIKELNKLTENNFDFLTIYNNKLITKIEKEIINITYFQKFLNQF